MNMILLSDSDFPTDKILFHNLKDVVDYFSRLSYKCSVYEKSEKIKVKTISEFGIETSYDGEWVKLLKP